MFSIYWTVTDWFEWLLHNDDAYGHTWRYKVFPNYKLAYDTLIAFCDENIDSRTDEEKAWDTLTLEWKDTYNSLG